MIGDVENAGWGIAKFGDIVTNEDGQRVPLKKSDRDAMTGMFPYYGASGVIDYVDDFLFEGERLLIGEDGANLIARSTPIAFRAHGKYWVNNHAHVLNSNGRADLSFLERYINSISLEPYLSGTAQPKLNQKNLNRIEIPLPPLAEQKKIAAILDAADQLRQKDQQLIDHYTNLSQSLFLEMFGDPVTNPMGWEKMMLSELGLWKSGGTPSRNEGANFSGSIPWVTSGELNDMYIKETSEHITKAALHASSAREIEKGAILLGMYDTAALKSSITTRVMSCNQAIAFATLDSAKANTVFVYFLIQLGKEHFRRLQRGVRQKNMNLGMIKGTSIILPPVELQNQFEEYVKRIESQKNQAYSNLSRSDALFNSLLQRAFKGELTSSKAA